MLIAKTGTVCNGGYASPSLHGQKRCKFQLNCHNYFYRRQFLYTCIDVNLMVTMTIRLTKWIHLPFYLKRVCVQGVYC